jgi:hypothetical protein
MTSPVIGVYISETCPTCQGTGCVRIIDDCDTPCLACHHIGVITRVMLLPEFAALLASTTTAGIPL